MSRIGRRPIPVPGSVTIDLTNDVLAISGPRGRLEQRVPERINVVQEDGTLSVRRDSDEPEVRALHGLIRSLAANMVTGVTDGFTKVLVISGVGYRATKDG